MQEVSALTVVGNWLREPHQSNVIPECCWSKLLMNNDFRRGNLLGVAVRVLDVMNSNGNFNTLSAVGKAVTGRQDLNQYLFEEG